MSQNPKSFFVFIMIFASQCVILDPALASELNLQDTSIHGPCASQVFPTSLLVRVADPVLDDCGADLHFALKTCLSGCLESCNSWSRSLGDPRTLGAKALVAERSATKIQQFS